jgi:hypothetical protein
MYVCYIIHYVHSVRMDYTNTLSGMCLLPRDSATPYLIGSKTFYFVSVFIVDDCIPFRRWTRLPIWESCKISIEIEIKRANLLCRRDDDVL